MKNTKTNYYAMNGMIAALYVALTILNPIGHGVIQIRISEALCVLPFIDKKYTSGILIGVAIANAFSPLGAVDVIFGLAVAITAYTLGRFINNIWVNILQYSLIAGVLIGIQLNLVLGFPFLFNLVSITLSTLLTTAAGAWLMPKVMERVDQRR